MEAPSALVSKWERWLNAKLQSNRNKQLNFPKHFAPISLNSLLHSIFRIKIILLSFFVLGECSLIFWIHYRFYVYKRVCSTFSKSHIENRAPFWRWSEFSMIVVLFMTVIKMPSRCEMRCTYKSANVKLEFEMCNILHLKIPGRHINWTQTLMLLPFILSFVWCNTIDNNRHSGFI